MATMYYEFKDERSNKFWEIEVNGKTVTVRYGKIGTTGQTTVKAFPNPSDANAHASKVTAEKTKKGYKKAKQPVAPEAKATGAKKKAGGKQPNQSAPDWQAIKVPAAGLKAFAKKSTKPKAASLRSNLAEALDGLKSGTLLVDKFASLEEIRAVLQHPNARKIEAIQLTSWSDEAREKTLAQYRKRAQELNAPGLLQGFTLPNFIFDVAYFYMEAASKKVLGFRLDWPPLNGLGNITNSYLFERVLGSTTKLAHDLDPQALLYSRYGHANFYYVPLVMYGSDCVTWGVTYDFESGELFDGLAYHDSGLYLHCYWHRTFETLQDYWKGSAEELDEMPEEYEDELLTSYGEYWLTSRLMVGYLQKFKVSCACENIKMRERRTGMSRQIGERGSAYFSDTVPAARVSLKAIQMQGLDGLRRGRMVKAIAVGAAAGAKNRARLAKELREVEDPTPIEESLAEILSNGDRGDGWDQVLSLAQSAADAGNPWLVLDAAVGIWVDANDIQASDKAAQLLQVLPNAFCPPFIKAICAAHAKTRYLPEIYTG